MPVLVQSMLGKRHGSAFGLGDGSWAVTCHHVVAFPLGEEQQHVQRTVTLFSPWTGEAETARVVATDAAADLALLRLETRGLPALPLAPRQSVEALAENLGRDDFRLALAGYPPPLRLPDPDEPITVRRNANALLAAGTAKGVPQFFLKPCPDAGPGWSGGPVYLPETNGVVGVFHALVARKSEPELFFPRATSALRIYSLLEEAGVKDFALFLNPPAPSLPSEATAAEFFRREMRASIAAQVGAWDVVQEERRAQLKLRPGSARAHAGLAGAYFALRKYEEAWAAWAQSARLDPRRARTFFGWGSALEQADRAEEAEERLRRAAELAPEDPDIQIGYAGFLQRRQKPQEALAALEKAVAAAPTHPFALGLKGSVLADLGRVEEGIAALRQAVALGVTTPLARSIRSTLVTALKKSDRLDEAEAELRRAVADGEEDALDHYHLATFLLERGKRDEARLHAQRCLDLRPSARVEAAARALLGRLETP